MLVFGYPTRQQKDRPKPLRCDPEHIVHENGYRRMEGPELRRMLRNRPGHLTYEAWCQALYSRKFNTDFSKEMTRSVEAYLEDFRYGTK